MAMTDYDVPRVSDEDADGLEEFKVRRAGPGSGAVDIDDSGLAGMFELPGAYQVDEELVVVVVPMQADEFRCTGCFLLRRRTQRAAGTADVCCECV